MEHDLVVHLNVGGVYFVTRRSTLTATPTFFASIVESHPDCQEIFVDRDPSHFRHVLNWMRGVRFLPEDEATQKELMWEADYYCIHDMREALMRTSQKYSLGRALHDIHGELRQRGR